MSASDQEEVTETPESRPASKREPKPEAEAESGAEGATGAEAPKGTETSAGDRESLPETGPATGPDTSAEDPDTGPDTGVGDPADAGHDDTALTPRQARRIRVTVASVLLVAMAALLAVRLANRSSVLVVGVYGLAMILCGVVIELSRHGRTRLATWVLGFGLAATLATDWLLLP
ncbi:hypothetical protein ABZ349_27625 [Streptomyces niveus]|uniref:hypothetical protein n=1 Tax=Streptomyces niveus TaxID=193462 RepID=UPI0033C62943